MSKQRCLICDLIRPSSHFLEKNRCLYCARKKGKIKASWCLKCNKLASSLDENKMCSRCVNKQNVPEKNKPTIKHKSTSNDVVSIKIKKIKKDIAKLICLIITETSMDEIPGYEELPINNLNVNNLVQNYSLEELCNILSILEFIYQQE